MTYEYKCVGAPEKGKRKRGAKTRSDRVANAMEQTILAEAVDGWEYLRTDLIPIEERGGMFKRPQEVHRAVMVFRRSIGRKPLFKTHEPEMPEDNLKIAASRDT